MDDFITFTKKKIKEHQQELKDIEAQIAAKLPKLAKQKEEAELKIETLRQTIRDFEKENGAENGLK